MKDCYSRVFKNFIMLMLVLALNVGIASAKTHHESLIRLTGHIPRQIVHNAVLLKSLDATTHVPLTFTLPLRNKQELEELIQRIHDPADSQHYGKYLTTEEFIERFAPTNEDYDKVIAYAKSLGLTVTGAHPNRLLLNVSGHAETMETAFNLNLYQYQLPSGRKFHAPSDEPEVPSSIASIIHGIVGLDNHAVWHPYNQKKETTDAFLMSNAEPNAHPSGPGGGYSPSDLLAAYNLAGISSKGSNQVIALFELGGYQVSDINAYTSHFGLPAAKLKNILVDGGAGGGIDAEVTLDIELALALAPESQIYVYEGPNSSQGVLDTYNRIATDNIAKQVSTSWGLGENLVGSQYLQAENAIFLQMAAHGQTVYAAAGDSGAYDNYPNNSSRSLVVDDPASQPYVVGVGGTKLTVSPDSGAYASEQVWNEGLGNGAGGGGVSGVWPIPSWQTNLTTATSKTNRNVPDVALNADTYTGYSIYHNGQWAVYGGTSCAAPLWAAFTACVNQERIASQKTSLGFANPIFYAIASGSAGDQNFHDIALGNNLYYSAHNSYDNASGWGSFNGANLFASLTNPSPTPPSPTPPPPQLRPLLNINMSHSVPFNKAGTGAYQISVANNGSGSTSGNVAVTIYLPQGLIYKSFSGSGWSYERKTHTFTNSAVLQPGKSYPPIALSVYVNYNAPRSVTTTATVSGGGSSSSTVSDLASTKK